MAKFLNAFVTAWPAEGSVVAIQQDYCMVAHKVSLRIFLFALVAHDVQFNFADAFKGAICF